MAGFGGLGSWCGSVVGGKRFLLFCVGLVAGWGGAPLDAQDDAIPTLHVYANLIQIPVVVLSPFHMPLAPIDPSRFSISLDSGPQFRPTHVRPEGDDPISLSILLDARGSQDDLLPKIDAAIADLAPLSLQARDHVSIYALDCSLIETLNNASAEREGLKRAVDSALQTWRYFKQNKRREDCKSNLHLWDSLTFIIQGLHRLPGRRVILAITDGRDKGSKYTWTEVRTYATATGAAVFGVMYAPFFGQFQTTSYEDAFNSVCELSGGMIFPSSGLDLAETLKRFVKTVRERYIVEFPRAYNSTPGQHVLVVTIDKLDAFIRPAGISVPIADPAVLADPSTVPADPSRTPVEGNRRVLPPPH
jgi:hypothetical protein